MSKPRFINIKCCSIIIISSILLLIYLPNAEAGRKRQLRRQEAKANLLAGINGRIFDDKKKPLPSAVIQIYQKGKVKANTTSDYDGNYKIYDVRQVNTT